MDDITVFSNNDFSIANVDRMVGVCTLLDLCKRIPLIDVHKEICKIARDEKISVEYEITATIPYLLTLKPNPTRFDFDDRICVLGRKQVMCQNGIFPLPMYAVNWSIALTYPIRKHPNLSDVEVLANIIWVLTYKGWPSSFEEWVGIKQLRDTNQLTQGNINNLIRKKLNIP